MHQADFERHVGAENICDSISDALERAAQVYAKQHISSSADAHKEDLAVKT